MNAPRVFLTFLLAAGLAAAQTGQPPARIVLPDHLATTATGRTVSGKSWAYVVVQPSDPAAMRGKSFRVYLKPAGLNAAGVFSPLGEIRPVTDPTTLGTLLNRAYTLGDDATNITNIINDLATQWKVGTQIVANGAAIRLSMLVNRASQSERDAATLRHLALAHPAFRLALGLAWGGPITPAPGTLCTAEVREIDAAGADLAVVGRCEFTAGQAAALAAPGAPVQVPDLTSQGDLLVKLRWSVPDALRRQALQTTGFRVWRIPSTAITPANLTALLATPGVKQVTLAPVLITKLYTSGNPAAPTDAANFTADPATFFAADDNDRDKTVAIVPTPAVPPLVQKVGTPHPENTTYKYFVAALDWLKQPGPLSPVGTGIAVRTLPPPVPAGLRVEEVQQGGGSSTVRFRVSFVGNSNTAPAVSATRYAIYRGGSDAESLERRSYLLPNPELPLPPAEPGLSPLVTLNHQSGRISHLDTGLSAAGNETATYWYCVRAIHDTLLGPVYSAPGPPVFGTFHDLRGPNAPTGSVVPDTLRALCRDDSSQLVTSLALPSGYQVGAKGRIIRLKAKRLDQDIVRVRFLVIDIRSTNTGVGPVMVFAPGEDEVFYDTLWIDPAFPGSQGTELVFAAYCQGKDGGVSYIAWRKLTWGGSITSSTGFCTQLGFECAAWPTSALSSSQSLSAKMLESPGTFTTAAEGTTVRATLGSAAFDGRTAIVTITRSGQATRSVLARVSNNLVTFPDPGRTTGGPPATFSMRVVRPAQNYAPGNETFADLPPAWPAASTPWPPALPTANHVAATQGGVPGVLTVALSLTPETKEYRIFRQVDGGELSLIAEGIADYDTSAIGQVIAADQPNLPASGRICYFGQLVDRHGNTSPLAQIGACIDLMAPTPIPVLNEPVAAGDSAAPKMNLEWFCPPDGVRRFRIRINDLTSGAETISSPGATQIPQDAADPIYFNPTPPTATATSLPQGSTFATNLEVALNGSGTPAPSTHTAQFSVQLDHDYQVEIAAEGINPADIQRSLPRKFVWRAPVTAGTVAWPARPLPRVVTGTAINLRARELHSGNTYFAASYASPLQHFNSNSTPVLVPLGLIPLTANGYTSSRINPQPAIQRSSYPLLTPDTTSALYRGTIDPNGYFYPIFPATTAATAVKLPPVALYRQIVAAQGLNTTDTGDLVQVSPLVSSIAWRNENGKVAIVDPLIVTLPAYDTATQSYTAASFWLPDTKPVTAGYTYRYYLVRFDTNGEIEQVINCGPVTITP